MLSERFKIVPVLSDQDLSGTDAGMKGDSINMSGYHKCTFIVGLQTLGGADPTVGVYSGATDAAVTTFVPFNYAYGSAAAGSANCDVLAAWTKATSVVTIANASKDNFMLIIEVDAAEMASTHKWLTIQFADPSTGATGNVQVHAVLQPRFGSNVSVTALA
jgi:hypothetical protein